MGETFQWSRNPELWAFRAKRNKLRETIEASRSVMFRAKQDQIERDYQRLHTRWKELVEDARFLKTRNDPQATHRLASHVAAFYQEVGIAEGRVDLVLNEVATINGVGLRTG
jgi:hypothetical protein